MGTVLKSASIVAMDESTSLSVPIICSDNETVKDASTKPASTKSTSLFDTSTKDTSTKDASIDVENISRSSVPCKNRITGLKRKSISPSPPIIQPDQKAPKKSDLILPSIESKILPSIEIKSKLRLNIQYPKLYEYSQQLNLDTFFRVKDNGDPMIIHKYDLHEIRNYNRITLANVCGVFIESTYCTEKNPSQAEMGNYKCFQCVSIPTITITDFLIYVINRTTCSNSSMVLMVIILQLLRYRCPDLQINILTIHRLVLISLLTASKFIDDNYDGNLRFAKVSNLNLKEINLLEVELLFLISFDLHHQLDMYARENHHIIKSVLEIQPELIKELKTKPQISAPSVPASSSMASSSAASSSSASSSSVASSSSASSFTASTARFFSTSLTSAPHSV